jgi:hypothetical protein
VGFRHYPFTSVRGTDCEAMAMDIRRKQDDGVREDREVSLSTARSRPAVGGAVFRASICAPHVDHQAVGNVDIFQSQNAQ